MKFSRKNWQRSPWITDPLPIFYKNKKGCRAEKVYRRKKGKMESMSKLANYSLGGCKGGLANWKNWVFPFRKSRRRRQYAILQHLREGEF